MAIHTPEGVTLSVTVRHWPWPRLRSGTLARLGLGEERARRLAPGSVPDRTIAASLSLLLLGLLAVNFIAGLLVALLYLSLWYGGYALTPRVVEVRRSGELVAIEECSSPHEARKRALKLIELYEVGALKAPDSPRPPEREAASWVVPDIERKEKMAPVAMPGEDSFKVVRVSGPGAQASLPSTPHE